MKNDKSMLLLLPFLIDSKTKTDDNHISIRRDKDALP